MCCFPSSCRPTGAVSWLASWAAFPFMPLLSAPMALLSLVRAIRSGSGWAMTRSTLLSPFVLVTVSVAACAVRDYNRGAAVLHRETGATPERDAGWNVDPRTRLPIERVTASCGARRFVRRVYDRVSSRLCRRFGPQVGSWKGALPSPREAGEALAQGRPVTLEEVRHASGAWHLAHCLGMIEGSPAQVPALRHGEFHDVEVIGTGPRFFVVLDSATGRKVATYGSLPR
ncbi:MAG: hypothetical protein IT452_18030 [Planctomycetia bacterium]|nr:hypothetical protein [Planctomycetia bacterium]